MADTITLDIIIDDTVDVTVVDSTDVDITTTEAPTFAVIAVEGPQGPPGPAFEGTAWWFGEGAPTTVIGSKPGDAYLDTITGTVYTLS